MAHLNSDILNYVFNFLWYEDIKKCEIVSKKWSNIIEKEFQYKRIICDQLSLFFIGNKIINNYQVILDEKINYKNAFYYLSLLPNKIDQAKLPNDENNKIVFKNNSIYFVGQNLGGDRIIYMNNFFPDIKYAVPNPFLFPILRENKYHLLLSNIYYYEITIEKTSFRQSWNKECIGIGFSKKNNITYGYQVGWVPQSYGYHSDDGNIYKSSGHGVKYSDPWSPGDTIGCGIKYNKKTADIFFTKNGNFLGFAFRDIKIKSNLIPALSIDSSYQIKVNFGQNEYQFKIENMIRDFVKYSKKIPINYFISTKEKNISIDYTYNLDQMINNITDQISNNIFNTTFNAIMNSVFLNP